MLVQIIAHFIIWVFLFDLRSPERREQRLFRISQLIKRLFSDEAQIRFLDQIGKHYICDRHFAHRYYFQYSRGLLGSVYKNELGQSKLLVPEQFLRVADNLEEFLDPVKNTVLATWKRERFWHESPPEVKSVVKKQRKIRILFLVRSWSFIGELITNLESRDDFAVDLYDFNEYEKALGKEARVSPDFQYRMNHLLYSFDPFAPDPATVWETAARVAPDMVNKVLSADVVFVDWMNFPTVWATRYFPAQVRIVSRCHSYEVFTKFAYSVDYSRLSHLIFVSEPISKIFTTIYGQVCSPDRISVVPNIRNLSRFYQAETSRDPDERRWKLGLLKYADDNKDPVFALQVLSRLVEIDSRWKLIMAGPGFGEESSDRLLEERCRRFIEDNGLRKNVEIQGYIKSVESWYREIGFILSTSMREGTHEVILEGMASGCVPVLRNWPMLKAHGGAEGVYPGWPAFDSPEDLAAWIVKNQDNFPLYSEKAIEFSKSRDIGITSESIARIVKLVVDEA